MKLDRLFKKLEPHQFLFTPYLGIVSWICGLYGGYIMGSEIVEHAKLATEPSALEMIVNQHPYITKILSTIWVGDLFLKGGIVSSYAIDKLICEVEEYVEKKRESNE